MNASWLWACPPADAPYSYRSRTSFITSALYVEPDDPDRFAIVLTTWGSIVTQVTIAVLVPLVALLGTAGVIDVPRAILLAACFVGAWLIRRWALRYRRVPFAMYMEANDIFLRPIRRHRSGAVVLSGLSCNIRAERASVHTYSGTWSGTVDLSKATTSVFAVWIGFTNNRRNLVRWALLDVAENLEEANRLRQDWLSKLRLSDRYDDIFPPKHLIVDNRKALF